MNRPSGKTHSGELNVESGIAGKLLLSFLYFKFENDQSFAK